MEILWPLTLNWALVITGAEVAIVTVWEGGVEGVTLTVKAVTCGSETVIVPGNVPLEGQRRGDGSLSGSDREICRSAARRELNVASLTPCCEGEDERLSWPVISPEYGWL